MIEKHPSRVVVDVGGVGYDVQVPLSTFYGLGEPGATVVLRIHTHVREDRLALYGFSTPLEQDLFERLIVDQRHRSEARAGGAVRHRAGGSHPRDPHAGRRALDEDPGVGKKTAERIGLELKDRLPQMPAQAADPAPAAGRPEDQLRDDLLLGAGQPRLPGRGGREGDRQGAQGVAGRGLRAGAARSAQIDDEGGMTDNRVVTPARADDDAQYEAGLRPRTLDDYIGQDRVRENLQVSIAAAKQRGEALDHVLLYGPPGLGKTTLAYVIATELGVAIRSTAGPVIEKAGDLAAMLTNLQERDVLFIDEVHRMPPAIEETLYPAMEDYVLDIMIGQGPGARSVKMPLQPYTLVGATTRTGLLTSPLRARFGIVHRLDYYSEHDIEEIVRRSARILGVPIDADASVEIARRSRGTPRVANRLLRRVRDFAQVRADGHITGAVADDALKLLEVDARGFDEIDRRLLRTIIDKFGGGPVGVGTLAAAHQRRKRYDRRDLRALPHSDWFSRPDASRPRGHCPRRTSTSV